MPSTNSKVVTIEGADYFATIAIPSVAETMTETAEVSTTFSSETYTINLSRDASGPEIIDKQRKSIQMSDMTRQEVKAVTEASEARVATAIAEMRTENEKARGEMSAFKNDVLTAIAGVRTDHAKEQVVATRWAIGVLFSILLGALGTIVTVVVRTGGSAHAPQPASQPTPIVIQVPLYQAATGQPATPSSSHAKPSH